MPGDLWGRVVGRGIRAGVRHGAGLDHIANLLTNGDCDALTGWSVVNGTLSLVTPAVQGESAMRITFDSGTYCFAYQSVLTDGHVYRVEGWGRGNGSASIKLFGGSVFYTGSPSTSWRRFSVRFTASYPQFRVYVGNAVIGDWVEIDGLRLTEV